MKQLHIAGHHVRKGHAVILLDSDDLTPVKFFGEMRLPKVRAIVERFNRLQVYKANLKEIS